MSRNELQVIIDTFTTGLSRYADKHTDFVLPLTLTSLLVKLTGDLVNAAALSQAYEPTATDATTAQRVTILTEQRDRLEREVSSLTSQLETAQRLSAGMQRTLPAPEPVGVVVRDGPLTSAARTLENAIRIDASDPVAISIAFQKLAECLREALPAGVYAPSAALNTTLPQPTPNRQPSGDKDWCLKKGQSEGLDINSTGERLILELPPYEGDRAGMVTDHTRVFLYYVNGKEMPVDAIGANVLLDVVKNAVATLSRVIERARTSAMDKGAVVNAQAACEKCVHYIDQAMDDLFRPSPTRNKGREKPQLPESLREAKPAKPRPEEVEGEDADDAEPEDAGGDEATEEEDDDRTRNERFFASVGDKLSTPAPTTDVTTPADPPKRERKPRKPPTLEESWRKKLSFCRTAIRNPGTMPWARNMTVDDLKARESRIIADAAQAGVILT